MKDYNPANWYWFVGGDQTKAFSSLTGDYVNALDPVFVEWMVDGTLPTRIDTETNLGDVLSQNLARPVAATLLDKYQDSQANGMVIQVNFKVLFNILKRLNALELKPVLTVAQARAAVKALM